MLKRSESKLLSAYIDRELKGEELEYVKDRLRTSKTWHVELEKLKRVKSLTGLMSNVSVPDDLVGHLKTVWETQVQREDNRRWSFPLDWRWVFTGATATAAVAASLVVLGIRSHRVNAVPIPLEILLAAHADQSLESPLYQKVVSASVYSDNSRRSHEDAAF